MVHKVPRRIVAALLIAAVVTGAVSVLRLDTMGESGSGLSVEFEYNLKKLAAVDPNLILYVESGLPVSTGFRQSRAIALDLSGRMYVTGDRAIRVLSRAGDAERVIDLAGEPRCLTVADDGTIYVGVADHVEVLGAQGQRVASWNPLGDEAVLTSIAKHKDDVFVVDAGHRIVLHYDAAGTLVGHIGEKNPDKNIPGFIIPSPHFDLAVSRDGLLRVVNPGRNRIETYTREGDLEFARRLLNRGEFDSALDILDRAYRSQPGDEALRRVLAEAEASFVEKAYRHYLPPSKVVTLSRDAGSLTGEHLSPTEFFLLSRIDGMWDVKSIIQITPLREVDVLRTLKRMREKGLIDLKDPVVASS